MTLEPKVGIGSRERPSWFVEKPAGGVLAYGAPQVAKAQGAHQNRRNPHCWSLMEQVRKILVGDLKNTANHSSGATRSPGQVVVSQAKRHGSRGTSPSSDKS